MLNAYSVDSLTIVRAADPPYDEWNQPNSPTTEDVNGYIEWKTKLVINFAGEEELAAGFVLIEYDADLTHEDKIRINSVDHPIVTIERLKDFSNVGTKVYFK